MTVLAGLSGLAVLESTVPILLLVLQNTAPRGNHDGFGDFGGCGGFGRDGCTP